MPGPTNTELIQDLRSLTGRLTERIDNVRAENGRVEGQMIRAAERVVDLDKRLDRVEQALARLESENEFSASRRWDFWKIVLAALLGGLLSAATGIAGRCLDKQLDHRPIPETFARRAPAP